MIGRHAESIRKNKKLKHFYCFRYKKDFGESSIKKPVYMYLHKDIENGTYYYQPSSSPSSGKNNCIKFECKEKATKFAKEEFDISICKDLIPLLFKIN